DRPGTQGRDPRPRSGVRGARGGDGSRGSSRAGRPHGGGRGGRHPELPLVVPVLRAARPPRPPADPGVPAKAAGMSRRTMAFAALVALFAGAAVLIALEFANGAAGAGELAVRDPCAPRPAYPGQGLDAVFQRIVLDGLDGAACDLGASREE